MLTLCAERFQLGQVGPADVARAPRSSSRSTGRLRPAPGRSARSASSAACRVTRGPAPRRPGGSPAPARRGRRSRRAWPRTGHHECAVELGVLAGQGLATLLQGGDPVLGRMRETVDGFTLVSLTNNGKTAGVNSSAERGGFTVDSMIVNAGNPESDQGNRTTGGSAKPAAGRRLRRLLVLAGQMLRSGRRSDAETNRVASPSTSRSASDSVADSSVASDSSSSGDGRRQALRTLHRLVAGLARRSRSGHPGRGTRSRSAQPAPTGWPAD